MSEERGSVEADMWGGEEEEGVQQAGTHAAGEKDWQDGGANMRRRWRREQEVSGARNATPPEVSKNDTSFLAKTTEPPPNLKLRTPSGVDVFVSENSIFLRNVFTHIVKPTTFINQN